MKLLDLYRCLGTLCLVSLGFSFHQENLLANCNEKNCLKGIDRIVPIGQALSIEFNWDGYELFNSMTRTISLR